MWTLWLLACAPQAPEPVALPGLSVRMDEAAAATDFWSSPFPDDARLRDGHLVLGHLPGIQDSPLLSGLAEVAELRRGASQVPVVYLPFAGALRAAPPESVFERVATAVDDDVVLVDVDAESPERGRVIPSVAATLPVDDFTPEGVLAVAPRPGFVLREHTTYAVLVRRTWGAADGSLLGVPAKLLGRLGPVAAAGDEEAWAVWTDVRETVASLGVAPEAIAAAARFSTGDVPAETAAETRALQERDDASLSTPAWFERDVPTPNYCELHATLDVPVYQRGVPPYNTDGRFVVGADGLPEVQERLSIPVVLTIPQGEMPAQGWPLSMYFHGSGGTSDQLVIRGPAAEAGEPEVGYGPAWVLARHGIAGVGSAHPVNPERIPGASSLAYLNFSNLAVFPFTFRQGIAEQAHLLDALLDLEIPSSALGDCQGPTLPAGASFHRFDPGSLVAMGQSMGGMYTNLIGATDPRLRAVVPTGAGGHWTRFVLETSLLGDGAAAAALRLVIGSDAVTSFLHPALHVGQLAWEPAEPLVYVPRLARRPLVGHPVRPIYEPVGLGDSYFPPSTFDSFALAYGNWRAGDRIWPSMDDALALDGRAALPPAWPIRNNAVSDDGVPYTGVVVQSAGDGFSDPHAIFTQLADIRHQYGCFFRSFLETGVASVVAPSADDETPCGF